MLTWDLDQYQTWNARALDANGRVVHIWLAPRPGYCDRGHWLGGCDGISSLDAADAFPRYYMNLERAKAEMEEWLAWRLEREAATD